MACGFWQESNTISTRLTHQSTCGPQNLFHPHNHVTSPNLSWISNKLNARSTFKHCISVLAHLIETIFTQCAGRSVYSKYIALPSLLAASCDGRGRTCSQDSGSNMGHLWFVVQIWAKWSYKTIFPAWVHYNQQYNIPELEEESSTSTGTTKLTILENIGSRDQTYKR